MKENYDLNYFIDEEKKGTIFCKIGKSMTFNGKGGHYNYDDHVGQHVALRKGDKFTFVNLNEILSYIYYGDELVLLNFSKSIFQDFEAISDSPSVNIFKSNQIYIDAVLPLKNKTTIDYIVKNAYDKRKLFSSISLGLSDLKVRCYMDSYDRLDYYCKKFNLKNEEFTDFWGIRRKIKIFCIFANYYIRLREKRIRRKTND